MTHDAESIFHSARNLVDEGRDRYLDDACGDDIALRAKVDALLDADADMGSFLHTTNQPRDDQPTSDQPSNNPPGSDSTVAQSHASRVSVEDERIVGYKILQRIGEGGFGVVFMAEQRKPIRRRVAIKIIKLGMDSKQILARFDAERQALALMNHPNIASVFDAGMTETGKPFFAMEYVVGDAITEFADARKLTIVERLTLFAQVCSAVQHAHTKGIIHRDLKPANILVSMVDGRPFAKVIDFGIAKATAGPLTDKTLYTEHHQLIGTPEYMSPEQAEGSPDIDTRTDVYALGVLLYELLTGQTPIDGARLRSAMWAEMQRIIKEEEPPAPSIRLSRERDRNTATAQDTATARRADPSKLSAMVKGELDWVVMKALDKDRARRYESPAQFASDIDRHLKGEAVQAAPPSKVYRLKKTIRKHKAAVITAACVAAALLLGIAGTTWQWRNAKASSDRLRKQVTFTFDTMQEAFASYDSSWNSIDPSDPDLLGGLRRGPTRFYGISGEGVGMGMGVGFVGVGFRPRDDTDFSKGYEYIVASPPGEDWITKQMMLDSWDTVDLSGGSSLTPKQIEDSLILVAAFGAAIKEEGVFQAADYRELMKQTDAAEWSSYMANLALAQNEMANGNWPTAREKIANCPESKRGWEWEYLNNKAESVIAEIRSDGSAVSPDGQHILAWTTRSAKLYDLDGNVIYEPLPPNADRPSIWTGRFSSDGTRFAFGFDYDGGEAYCQVFDMGGEASEVHFDNRIPGQIVQLSPSGSMLASGSDGKIRLYANSGEQITILENTSYDFWRGTVRFSPDESLIASVANHGVQLWKSDGTFLRLLAEDTKFGGLLTFSPAGKHLAAASGQRVYVWTVDGELIAEFVAHDFDVQLLKYIPESTTLITSDGGQFRAWDRRAVLIDECRHAPASANVFPHYFDSTGSLLLLVSATHRSWDLRADSFLSLCLWDANGTQTKWSVSITNEWYDLQPRFDSGNGSVLVAAGNEYYRFDLEGHLVEQGSDGITNNNIQPVGSNRYVGQQEGSIGIGLRDNARTIGRFPLRFTRQEISRGHHAKFFAASVLAPRDGELAPTPTHSLTEADAMALDHEAKAWLALPDGSRIVTASDRAVRFWDPETSREVVVIPIEEGPVSLGLSPDTKRLVIECSDGSVTILDTRSPEQQAIETKRDWAERIPAGKYLDTLMAGPTPTDELESAVASDKSLTPLRRLVATEVLQERLRTMQAEAGRAYASITKDATDKVIVQAAAEATDLPKRTKEILLEKIKAWEPEPSEPSESQ